MRNRVKNHIVFAILSGLFTVPFNFVLAADTNYRFTGQELDKETGIYDYGARNYNPNTGRFLQQDPVLKDGSIDAFFLNNATKEELNEFLSNPQKLNEYSYVLNNPVKYVDPTGESEVSAWLNNPYFTAQQISLWNNVVVNGYFRNQGKNISAAFLQQSLKLRIGHNLNMNIKEGGDPNNVINTIKQSDDYKAFVKEKMEQAKKSGEAFIHFQGGVGTENNSLVFNNGDLQTSIGKATNIYIDGKMMDNGTWQLNVKMYDQYNFEITDKYKNAINSTGNNLATLSQTQGAISNYDINIEFNDTW